MIVKQDEDRSEHLAPDGVGLVVSQCVTCKHKKQGKGCAAFPNGIPEEILLNEFDHTEPYYGDDGIQYEEKE